LALPAKVMSRLFAVTDTRLWRVIQSYVEMARAAEDYTEVKRIGADETIAGRSHDEKFVTFFFDLGKHNCQGPPHSTVASPPALRVLSDDSFLAAVIGCSSTGTKQLQLIAGSKPRRPG